MSERPTVSWNDETQGWDDGVPAARCSPPPAPGPVGARKPVAEPDGTPEFPPFDAAEPAEPETGPEPEPGSRLGPPPAAVAAVAVVLTVGLLAWLGSVGGDDEPSGALPGSSQGVPEPTFSPSDPYTPTAPHTYPSAEPSQTVDGARIVVADGFRIAVPFGWESREQEGVDGVRIHYWVDPAEESRFVQVFRITEEDVTPTEALKLAEKDLEKGRNDYRRNSLSSVNDPRGEAAELDYSFRREGTGERIRVVDRVLHGDSDTLYAVLVAGPESGWPLHRLVQARALSGFAVIP